MTVSSFFYAASLRRFIVFIGFLLPKAVSMQRITYGIDALLNLISLRRACACADFMLN